MKKLTVRFVLNLMCLIAGVELIPAAAHAAFTLCSYQQTACDPYGNHYYCQLTGWTGPNSPTYCSPDDRSTGPGVQHSLPQPVQAPAETCGDCTGQPQPDNFCRQTCGCESAFCGAW